MTTRGELTENDTDVPGTPNEYGDYDGKVSFAMGTRALPVFAQETTLGDDGFEVVQLNDDDKGRKIPTDFPPPPPASNVGGDNVSIANSEVVLRNPLVTRQISKHGTPSLIHSHSTSDLIRLRNPHGKWNPKDPKSMILPIASNNRSRSPFSVHSLSYDGLNNLVGHPYGNSNPNLASPSTPQDQFFPYVPGQGGGGGYGNGSIMYQNGGYPNGGYQNGGYPNGGYQNGGYIVSSGDFDQRNQMPKRTFTPLTSSSSHHKLPTPPEAKKKMFTDILSTSLSTIYAILIITLGVSFYVIDYLDLDDDNVNYLAEGFSLTLLGVALFYLLFLCIDISVYNHKKKKFEKLMETIQPEHMEVTETNEGVSYDVTLHKALALRKKLDHRYCFNMDRHSSNFYLKIGAAGFCFGHLIHSFLILTYRGVILNSENELAEECMSVITFIIEILYPLYSITLLFFIFKYSNVIINKNRDMHRFGFMHCLASSLCFWLWTIFRETAEYIQNSKYKKVTGNDTLEDIEDVTPISKNTRMLVPYRFTAICEHVEMNVLYQNYSPYLYPFSVEYSILVVGIIYIVWVNIGLCAANPGHDDSHHHAHEDTRECRNDRRQSEPESNLTVHADCHASNKGLFGGFIVLVFTIVSIILFFITFYNETTELAQSGLIINQSTKIIIISFMVGAVIFAYFQMVKLDVNEAAHNSLDNFLCLMCLPAFFVHGIFSIIAGIVFGNVLAVIGVMLEIIQVVIQTPFIMDGMARSSNTKVLRKKKPGREFVTFLVICNVAMWIMQTFEVKSHGLDQYRQDFYSKELWSIVGHMCLPLMMFYRFHSSVCIGDIWKYAYMPSGH